MSELLNIYLNRLEEKGQLTKTGLNYNVSRSFPILERSQVLRKAILKKLVSETYIGSKGKGRPKTLYSITEKGKAFLHEQIEKVRGEYYVKQ